MNHDSTNIPVSPRWLHLFAVLTVLFTLPLLFLGAGVTSHGPGVALIDKEGFRPPWVIITRLLENFELAFILEYGHRTFGFLVGICAIGLAVGCWFFDRRAWLGWFAFLALALICVQGALGIFRVDYNALYGRTFALIHGCFAQIVFAVLVSLALITSRRWLVDTSETASSALKRWALVTVLVVYAQLVLGGLVRHREDLLGPRGHLLGAFVVTGMILWLLRLMAENEARERFKLQRIALMALLSVQLVLGVESWLARFYVEHVNTTALTPLPLHQEWIRTAHYLVGTLIFSTTVVVALIAHRHPVLAPGAASLRLHEAEGAV